MHLAYLLVIITESVWVEVVYQLGRPSDTVLQITPDWLKLNPIGLLTTGL
jgi:hypothetical protein